MGIFELPNMMNPDGTMGNIIVAFAGIAISMAVGFVLTMMFYRDEKEKVQKLAEDTESLSEKVEEEITVYSPLKGTVIPLTRWRTRPFPAEFSEKGRR